MAKTKLHKRTENGTLRSVVFHHTALAVIRHFPQDVRFELGYLIYRLQQGEGLSMPHSRPMQAVTMGVFELRVRGEDGIFRVFYYTKSRRGILVFHAFVKKTQKTSIQDINLARKRLIELSEEE